MVTNAGKHPVSSTALLYVWRKKGGRGLQSAEVEFKVTKIKAAMKLYSSSDPSMKMVGEPEERSAALGYQSLIAEALRYSDAKACLPGIHVEYSEIIRFTVLHNRYRKVSRSSCMTKPLLFC